jgi:hypothetical protein
MSKGAQNINIDTEGSGDTTKFIVYGVVGIAVLGIAYFGIIRPVLKTFQVIDTKEEKKGKKDAEKLSRKQVLTSSFYKKNRGKVTISSGSAHTAATEIYNGKGTVWDDEDMAVGEITGAGSLVNLSYIAYTFYKVYGRSMEGYLSYLEPEDWTSVDNYISKTKRF